MAHAAFLASPACPALGPSRLTAPRHRRVPSKSSRLITRAKAADDVGDEDAKAFMGRRGTRREDVEDDADTAKARSSVKQQGGFGKPVTAKETWQPFQRTARAGLLEAADGERTGSPDHRDLVRTSLYISMEDDAFKSRTAVCLPIAAYVKRVDKLMDEFTAREIPALVAANGGTPLTTLEIIEALETHLFVTNKYAPPKGWREVSLLDISIYLRTDNWTDVVFCLFTDVLPVQNLLSQRSRAEDRHPSHTRRALHRMRRQAPRQGCHPRRRVHRRTHTTESAKRDRGGHSASRAVGKFF